MVSAAAADQLVFLPEQHTDFVFRFEPDWPALALWLVGAVVVVALVVRWVWMRRRR
jgi:hypothetical protein